MSGATAMRENLRQMIAVLQAERQALAGLDLDAIMGCANVSARLDALTGSPALYRAGNPALSAYTYTGSRG